MMVRALALGLLLTAAVPAPAAANPVADAAGSVVQVRAGGSVGTGFVVEDGVVVTAAHVVAGAARVRVRVDGAWLQAAVLVADDAEDLSLLRPSTELPTAVEPLQLAPKLPELASDVFALTAPAQADQITISRGIVSGVFAVDGLDVIQTDAAINPGSSGGPVIDPSGMVIGVTSSKLEGAEGVAYAIPSAALADLLEIAPDGVTGRPTARRGGEAAPVPAVPQSAASDLQLLLGAGVFVLLLFGVARRERQRRQHRADPPFHIEIDLGPTSTSLSGPERK